MVRVTELYSGLGGFHLAVEASGIESMNVQAAFDMNDVANTTYKHNFGDQVHVSNRNVLFLKPGDEEFENNVANADLLLLSPPCQPYTRRKLNPMCNRTFASGQQDRSGKTDARALSIHHLINLIHTEGKPLPQAILIENVLGFEKSETFMRLHRMFQHHKYIWQGIVMSPTMLGIPNSRPRLFILARREPFGNPAWNSCVIQEEKVQQKTEASAKQEDELDKEDKEEVNDKDGTSGEEDCPFERVFLRPGEMIHMFVNVFGVRSDGLVTETMKTALDEVRQSQTPDVTVLADKKRTCLPLSSYLQESLTPEEVEGTTIQAATLWKAGNMFELVTPGSRWSNCFTKSYSRFQLGAGSILCMHPDIANGPVEDGKEKIQETYKSFFEKRNAIVQSESFQTFAGSATSKWAMVAESQGGCTDLESLQLRYFTPREIAALMGFPAWYDFPKKISFKQCYSLLGNSLNVKVVAFLLRYLMNIFSNTETHQSS